LRRQQPVDFIDKREERGSFVSSRMRQIHGQLRHHSARRLGHNHDPIGKEHGFFDIMRDHQDGFRGDFSACPEFQQFPAQGLRTEHIEG
jgi:hypothetical protein